MSRIVARGSIRVDARRAVEKLRDHLLVDLHQYLLELVRAAAAGGATQIDVRCDSDDVLVTFDGEPLEAATLPRLLDHVLNAACDRETRRLRLFALGINAALGLKPARIDVFTTKTQSGNTTRCTRGRFFPTMLEASGHDGGAAAAPECEEVAKPAGMPAKGMRIELRRKIGWTVLKRALAGGLAREIELLVAATVDFPVAITLEGALFDRPDIGQPLLRVPFSIVGAKRAVLEVMPALSTGPVINFLEHGVRLLQESWSFAPHFPSMPYQNVELPIRIVVDAEELPTNASRSALREDAPLRQAVNEAAMSAFLEALRALIELVGQGLDATSEDVFENVEVLDRDQGRLENALGAIACVVTGHLRAGGTVSEEAAKVRHVGLLRDGLGRPISIASLEGRGREILYLWRGNEPLPEELAPWMRDVVWLRGQVAEQALAGFRVAEAKAFVERAKVGAARRKSLMAHAASEPVVAASSEHLFRAAFDVSEGDYAGLRGEVAVSTSKPAPPATVRVFVEQRHLATIELDTKAIPLPVEIALTWPGYVRPTLSYEGVEENTSLNQAVWYALRIAILACDEEAKRLFSPGKPAVKGADGKSLVETMDQARGVLRAAIGTLLLAPAHLEVGCAAEDHAPKAFEGLFQARLWPTTEPQRHDSLRTISVSAGMTGGVCVATADARGRAADGRSVLALGRRELSWLEAAIPGCEFIPYTDALWTPELLTNREVTRKAALMESLEKVLLSRTRSESPMIEMTRVGQYALMMPNDVHVAIWHHASRKIESIFGEYLLGPMAIAIDADNVMPNKDWTKLLSRRYHALLQNFERTLCETLVGALEGDPTAQNALSPQGEPKKTTHVTGYLMHCARSLAELPKSSSMASRNQELLARIRMLPLVAVLDSSGAPTFVTLTAVEQLHPGPGPIPMLDAVPGFETLDWRPVLVRDGHEREAFSRWAKGRAIIATSALASRQLAALAERRKREFLTAPEQDPYQLEGLADPQPQSIILEATLSQNISAAVALPRQDMFVNAALADILFCKRMLCRNTFPQIAIPVVARINVTDESLISDFHELSMQGSLQVADRIHEAAAMLAFHLIQQGGAVVFGDVRALALIAKLLTPEYSSYDPGRFAFRTARVTTLSAKLNGYEFCWPTVQGEQQPLPKLLTLDQQLCIGTRLYNPWQRGSRTTELDSPVMLVPDNTFGTFVREILAGLGYSLRDVTEPMAALQARRAAAGTLEAPRLTGSPAHPLLRQTLAAIGVHVAEGEVEIIEGPASEVHVLGLDGTVRAVSADLPIPMRIVARIDSLDDSRSADHALLKRIAKAGGQYVMSLVPRFDDMPAFVRAHARRVVCKMVADGKRVAAKAANAPLFGDIRGNWYSLNALRDAPSKEWLSTQTQPPYPTRQYHRPVLCLGEVERTWLLPIVPIKNITGIIERDLLGEQRAVAKPLDVIALDQETRMKCFDVIRLQASAKDESPSGAQTMVGEIGLLMPEHRASAKIEVFVGHRHVCKIAACNGWPVVAAINDDTLQPNRYFDGLKTTLSAEGVQQKVHAAVMQVFKARIQIPEGVLAVHWLNEDMAPKGHLFLAGALWLPASWPLEPRVMVHKPAGSILGASDGGATLRALSVSSASSYVSGLLPVEGVLFISDENRWKEVGYMALRAINAMVAKVADVLRGDVAVATYQWNLRFLGQPEGGAPKARTGTGEEVGPSEVLAELSARGCLWTTSREGSIEGRFPEGTPSFVLLDDGAPLIHVLRHRGVRGVLKELGSIEEASTIETTLAMVAFGQEVAEQDVIVDPFDSAPVSEPGGWMSDLWRTIRSFLEGRPSSPPEHRQAGKSQKVATALTELLDELGVAGDPVAEVVERRSGRPIRYEPKRLRLVINPDHEALRWLHKRGEPDAAAMTMLAAAAISEINRALKSVTDAEERRLLHQLLHSLPS